MTRSRITFIVVGLAVAWIVASSFLRSDKIRQPSTAALTPVPDRHRHLTSAIFARSLVAGSVTGTSSPASTGPTPGVVIASSSHSATPLAVAPSERVATVIGRLTDRSYLVRHRALQTLSTDLTAEEVGFLLKFLSRKTIRGLDAAQARALKNDLLNTLREQTVPPAGLDETLLTIYRDPDQELAMRDYAIQHLTAWYGQADAARQPEIRRALLDAVAETDSSIGGTALIGLYHLTQENHPEIDRNALASVALSVASDTSAGELARVTAVQVCSQLHQPELVTIVNSLAQENNTSMPLRIAAIAALGDVGGGEVVPLLQNWITGPETRLHLPAQSALKRLNQRLNQ